MRLQCGRKSQCRSATGWEGSGGGGTSQPQPNTQEIKWEISILFSRSVFDLSSQKRKCLGFRSIHRSSTREDGALVSLHNRGENPFSVALLHLLRLYQPRDMLFQVRTFSFLQHTLNKTKRNGVEKHAFCRNNRRLVVLFCFIQRHVLLQVCAIAADACLVTGGD